MSLVSLIVVIFSLVMSSCNAGGLSTVKGADKILHAEADSSKIGFFNVTCQDGHLESVAADLLLAACTSPQQETFLKVVSNADGLFCAIDAAGKLICQNLGVDTFTMQDVPPDLGPVKDIAISETLRCAIRSDDSLRCWGSSTQGALESLEQSQLQDAESGTIRRVKLLAVSNEQICLSSWESDQIECYGKDSLTEFPYHVLNRKAEQLTGGYSGFCAVYEGGWVNCWGPGHDYMFPRKIQAVETSGNGRIYCVLDQAGIVECSALNEHTLRGSYPILGEVTSLSIFDVNPHVDISDSFACVARKNQPAYCWGSNSFGQTTPPASLGEVRSIALSTSYACALTARMEVSCWHYGDDKTFRFPADEPQIATR